MARNFWSHDELIEKARSGEITQPEQNQKWSVINQGDYCTLFAADVGAPKGYPLHVHQQHDESSLATNAAWQNQEMFCLRLEVPPTPSDLLGYY
jgi:uncharacterized protein YbjT (DUF2867 family)